MNLVLVVLCKSCCRSIARVVNLSSNVADLIRDLRLILIAAQKNYVLDAPLGDRPIAGADADVMNVWLAQYDDYLIV